MALHHNTTAEQSSAASNAWDELAAKERETMEVIKADVCQWLCGLLKIKILPEEFLQAIDTGVLVCKLARLIQTAAKKAKKPSVEIPMGTVHCNEKAAKESFAARDNTSNFLSWCRGLGVEEAVMFESEGLVLHRDEKRVILCLLDVARFAEKVGIPPPQLVKMEKEIDMLETTKKGAHTRLDEKEKALREKVMRILKACSCSHDNNPLHVGSYSDGKFVISGGRIRGDKTLYARLLSDRIMVRVGGGWVTLEHFLLEHDPCRIKNFVSEGTHGRVTVTSARERASN